ncbi:MAG: undecaprenyldiphospho-muramoylpentapeptide beta-N-acetylglucosaminyltransferase [Cyclobacteriaceae bacterium]
MEQLNKPYRIIISGGGTGGHIYPAIAVANEVKARNPKNEVLFVGAKGRMEMEKVPKAGYHIIGLWISGLQRKILSVKNILFPIKLIFSLIKGKLIITKFRPDAVAGFGGYASAPLVKMARRNKVSIIQEQNAFAGMTNQWVAGKVDKVCVAHEKMEDFFPKEKIVITGNPVRTDITNPSKTKEEALAHFGMKSDLPTILVIGGSLGAKTINEAVKNHVDTIHQGRIQLIWQTGKTYFKEIEKNVCSRFSDIYVSEFIYEMDLAYQAADVVISRAGALSISELAVAGKAAVLVPSPNVAEDHQTKNAQALVDIHAALLVKDSMAMERLIPLAMDLVKNEQEKTVLSNNILSIAKPKAAAEIVDVIEQLIVEKRG